MNFAQYANNNEQKLVDDLATIKSNLVSLFEFYSTGTSYTNAHYFNLTINGLHSFVGRIRDGKFTFKAQLGKKNFTCDNEGAASWAKENVVSKLNSKVTSFVIQEYSIPRVEIQFDELTEDVVKDIMLIANHSSAKLRPKNIRSW